MSAVKKPLDGTQACLIEPAKRTAFHDGLRLYNVCWNCAGPFIDQLRTGNCQAELQHPNQIAELVGHARRRRLASN